MKKNIFEKKSEFKCDRILNDCPILVLSECRNFTTSEKQKTLTKQTPIAMVR